MLRSKSCKINSHLSNLVCRGAGWVAVLQGTKFYQRLPSDSVIFINIFIQKASISAYYPSLSLSTFSLVSLFFVFPCILISATIPISSFPFFCVHGHTIEDNPSCLLQLFHFGLLPYATILGNICLYVTMLFNKRHWS